MTRQYGVHPDDVRQLLRIRRYLIGYRITNGWTQAQLSDKVNGSEGAVYDLESNDTWQWRLSRLQDWVAAFGLRLGAKVMLPSGSTDFAVHVRSEVAAAYDLSVSGANWRYWQRVYLPLCLKQARIELGVSAKEMARRLNVTPKAVTNDDNSEYEPLLAKLMQHARALGCWIRLNLQGEPMPGPQPNAAVRDEDWHTLSIMCPDYKDIEVILETMKRYGFEENDWCALNRYHDGATVSWGPMENPGTRPYPWEVG